jgi:hypothetical protein
MEHICFQLASFAARRERVSAHWRESGARRGGNAIQTGIGVSKLNQKTKGNNV